MKSYKKTIPLIHTMKGLSAEEGELYYNPTTETLNIFKSGAWEEIVGVGSFASQITHEPTALEQCIDEIKKEIK